MDDVASDDSCCLLRNVQIILYESMSNLLEIGALCDVEWPPIKKVERNTTLHRKN